MKLVIIIAIAFVLLIPVNAFSISISEIENKLLQAQSKDDVESVLVEIYTSDEYQEACQLLLDKISSMPPPKTQADGEKALPILRDYENLKCSYTKKIWGDPPEQLSRTQCSELIVKFEDYNEKYWAVDRERQRIFHTVGLEASYEYLETSEWWYLKDLKREVSGEYRNLCLPTPQQCEEMKQESSILNKKYSELDEKYHNEVLEQKLVRIDMKEMKDRIELRCDYKNSIMSYYEAQEKYFGKPVVLEPEILEEVEIVCGEGTVLIDHICQVDPLLKQLGVSVDKELLAQIPKELITRYCNVYDTEIENLKKYGYSESMSKVFGELSSEEIIEELEYLKIEMGCKKKSVNWFSSFFDWLGGLFQ